MVAFLRDPTIEEEHELNQQPSKLDFSDDPLPLDDCSLSFADSFLDFDSIGDWIEEIPVVDMADSNPDTEKVVDLVKMDVGAVEGFNKDGCCRETNFGFQKLGELGASFEEEIGEISLEEGLNGLIVADTNDKKCPVLAGADGIGVMSGQSVSVKGVETVSVNENAVNSGKIISVDNDSVKSCETLGIDESDKGVEIVGVNENVVNNGEMISVDNGSFRSCKTLGIDESGKKMGEIVAVNGDAKKSDETKSDEDEGEDEDEDESDGSSDSTTESSSSSSSSSSSEEEEDEDDKEEEKMKKELKVEIDMEEGEIRDSDVEHMMAWSDNEYDEEDGGDMKGPIKSRNELKVLPPVPPVNVTLQPHHQTQPVGIILSIIGAQVIVEGIEKHNPLNEGSILWITESRSPLGLVDEIFGPVKNPYYMIRYNSDDEVPTGVKTGTSISFVPEFANHVLNDPNLYKKGYDASGDNDEELSDELEFSDDEKEAEYKKMLKMSKRGTNDDPKLGNKKKDGKKFKNRGRTWQNSQPSTSHTQERVHQPPTNQNQHCMPPSAASLEQGNCSHSFGMGQGFAGSPGLGPPFPQLVQAPGFVPPSSVVWTNGMPCQQQQQSMVFPNGVPTNSMPWLQQNNHQQAYQMPLPNIMPFQQHLVPSQGLPSNFILPGAQPNFCAGQSSAPWPAGCLGQTGFNQPFAMGLQFQQVPPMSMNAGEQPRPPVPGNVEDSQKFNHGPGPGPGRGRGRGRGRGHRGSGRFGGGRGRQQSN